MSLLDFNFHCEHCGRRFKKENAFLNHRCKHQERIDELKTLEGELAFIIYSKWLKHKKARPSKKTFITSQYYKTFFRISNFLIDVDVISVSLYVDFMIRKKYLPSIWYRNEVFSRFIEYLDKDIDPLILISISVETICKISEDSKIGISEFFDHLSGQKFIHLLQTRKLSPWLLFYSSKFRNFYRNKLNADQKVVVNAFFDPHRWSILFKKNSEVVKKVKFYLTEMGLE